MDVSVEFLPLFCHGCSHVAFLFFDIPNWQLRSFSGAAQGIAQSKDRLFFLDTWQYRVLSSVECGVGQQNPRSYLSSRGGRPTITLPHHRLGSLTHSWMQVLIPGGVRGYLQSTRYIGQWPHSCPLPASAHPRQPLSMLAGALVVECRQQAGERPAASQQAHPPWIIDGVCRYELRALAHSCSFKLAPAQAEFRPFLR